MRELCHVSNKTFSGAKLTSLCPVLGKNYASIYEGICPTDLQQPGNKILPISFIGPKPYIKYNPIAGSDFLVIKLLAEKHHFVTKFRPERSVEGSVKRVMCYL